MPISPGESGAPSARSAYALAALHKASCQQGQGNTKQKNTRHKYTVPIFWKLPGTRKGCPCHSCHCPPTRKHLRLQVSLVEVGKSSTKTLNFPRDFIVTQPRLPFFAHHPMCQHALNSSQLGNSCFSRRNNTPVPKICFSILGVTCPGATCRHANVYYTNRGSENINLHLS